MKKIVLMCLFIFTLKGEIKEVKRAENVDDQERELMYGFGPYHPLYNPTLSSYTNLHHNQDE